MQEMPSAADGRRDPLERAALAVAYAAAGLFTVLVVLSLLRSVEPAGSGRFWQGVLFALLLGAIAGTAELVSRYRDRPFASVRSFPGVVYLAINAFVALCVFVLLETKQIVGQNLTAPFTNTTLNHVLVGGLGAMALFRTSIFTVRVRDNDIAIGPAAVLQILLNAVDREVDRQRAGPRAQQVVKLMRGVGFDDASRSLPYYCFALMQNITAEERSLVSETVERLKKENVTDEARSAALGLLLLGLVGEDVLRSAIAALGSQLRGADSNLAEFVAREVPKISSEATINEVISLAAALAPDEESAARRDRLVDMLGKMQSGHAAEVRRMLKLIEVAKVFGTLLTSQAIGLMMAQAKKAEPVSPDTSVEDLM